MMHSGSWNILFRNAGIMPGRKAPGLEFGEPSPGQVGKRSHEIQDMAQACRPPMSMGLSDGMENACAARWRTHTCCLTSCSTWTENPFVPQARSCCQTTENQGAAEA